MATPLFLSALKPVARLAGLSLFSGLIGAGAAYADSEIVDVQAMGWASACVTCHGASSAFWAGAPADKLIAKMQELKEDKTPGALMPQIARGYDDETLARIAKWYEQQGGKK